MTLRQLLNNGDDNEQNTTHLQKKERASLSLTCYFSSSIQDLRVIPNLRKGFSEREKPLN